MRAYEDTRKTKRSERSKEIRKERHSLGWYVRKVPRGGHALAKNGWKVGSQLKQCCRQKQAQPGHCIIARNGHERLLANYNGPEWCVLPLAILTPSVSGWKRTGCTRFRLSPFYDTVVTTTWGSVSWLGIYSGALNDLHAARRNLLGFHYMDDWWAMEYVTHAYFPLKLWPASRSPTHACAWLHPLLPPSRGLSPRTPMTKVRVTWFVRVGLWVQSTPGCCFRYKSRHRLGYSSINSKTQYL